MCRQLQKDSSPAKAKVLRSFFKTGPEEYGEGDVFIGVTVPQVRKLAARYRDAGFPELKSLLQSKVHEQRLLAVIILVMQFRKADVKNKKQIFDFYIKHRKHVNNWDLVDQSAYHIVGAHLKDRDRSLLVRFANSENLWERRMAVVSTFHYIGEGESENTFKIAKLLLNDKHDLIHKAVGWMLREVGKHCSERTLDLFLKKHASRMPRTTLRYAIERFPETKRKRYLAMKKKFGETFLSTNF